MGILVNAISYTAFLTHKVPLCQNDEVCHHSSSCICHAFSIPCKCILLLLHRSVPGWHAMHSLLWLWRMQPIWLQLWGWLPPRRVPLAGGTTRHISDTHCFNIRGH